LTAHDFFDAQPIKNADVFLLKAVLHNWSDKYCLKILHRLREAATPSTQLIVFDSLVLHACIDEDIKDVPGAEPTLPPAPLLPNWGHASAVSYLNDLGQLVLMNGKERTTRDFRGLLESTGWKLVRIVYSPGYTYSKAIAVPI
jgi:hypothetical protein